MEWWSSGTDPGFENDKGSPNVRVGLAIRILYAGDEGTTKGSENGWLGFPDSLVSLKAESNEYRRDIEYILPNCTLQF